MTDFANFLREILGIADYFMISEIKKKADPKKTIEIHLTYSPKVYKVSGKEYRLYDQSPERKWQHLSWFDYTCFIVCSLPRSTATAATSLRLCSGSVDNNVVADSFVLSATTSSTLDAFKSYSRLA